MRRLITSAALATAFTLSSSAFASVALALDAHPQGIWATSTPPGKSAFTTPSFTPPANSLLAVRVQEMGEGTSGALGDPLISGGGLAFQARAGTAVNLTSPWSVSETWFTAALDAAPGPMTITVDDPQNRSAYLYAVSVIAFTGYDTVSPIGGTFSSGTNAGLGDGPGSGQLTEAPGAEDITLASVALDSTLGPPQPSWSSDWEPVHEVAGTAGEAGMAIATRADSTSKAIGVDDVYGADGFFFKAGLAAIVIRGEPGGG